MAENQKPINCVYLVGAYHMAPCGYYKIGISSQYKSRINQIQSCSPFAILTISVVEHSNPYELEQKILDVFSSFRIRGEWFCMYGSNIKEESEEFEKAVAAFMKENCDGRVIK